MHILNQLGDVKVITLMRKKERVENVINEMARAIIDFEYFEAIDGKSYSDDAFLKLMLEHNIFEHNKASKGPLSCTLSHILLLKEFLDSDHEYLTVFEDDIYFPPIFMDKIDQIIKQLPDQFDKIYLGHCGERDSIHNKTDKLFFKNTAMCDHAYIISKRGAERTLKLLTPCFHTIDIVIHTSYVRYLSGRPGFQYEPYLLNNFALGYENTNPNYYSDGIVHQKRGELMISTLGLHD